MTTFLEALNGGPSTEQKVTQHCEREFETFNQHNKQLTEESSTEKMTEDWLETEAAIAQHHT
jgi:hypothetical protein